MLNQIMTNVSLYVNHFLFEILDEHTVNVMESGIKRYLKELRVFNYKLRITILDKTNVKIKLQYDDNNVDFYLGKA
jgi:hypothetical protein